MEVQYGTRDERGILLRVSITVIPLGILKVSIPVSKITNIVTAAPFELLNLVKVFENFEI